MSISPQHQGTIIDTEAAHELSNLSEVKECGRKLQLTNAMPPLQYYTVALLPAPQPPDAATALIAII